MSFFYEDAELHPLFYCICKKKVRISRVGHLQRKIFATHITRSKEGKENHIIKINLRCLMLKDVYKHICHSLNVYSVSWRCNKTSFLFATLSEFCLSTLAANSVWVTEHWKMPKLQRAFKWREIEYARLTLTDLANVKQLSWATRAAIIIVEAHFQVHVEREDIYIYIKKYIFINVFKKMFYLLSCPAQVRDSENSSTSVFTVIDITLIFQISWMAEKGINFGFHPEKSAQQHSQCIWAVTELSNYSDADNWFMCKCLRSPDGSQSI